MKRPQLITYTCCLCPAGTKPIQAPEGSALELLQVCGEHQKKRFADGMQKRREAEAKEALARG